MAKRVMMAMVIVAGGIAGCGQQQVKQGPSSLTQQWMAFNKNGWNVTSGEIEEERAKARKNQPQGRVIRSTWGAGEVKFNTTFSHDADAPDSFEDDMRQAGLAPDAHNK